MKFSNKENEAAIVIQRCVRRHLRRDGDIKPIDENDKGEISNAKNLLDEVNLFYKKLYSNLKKKEEIKKLCDSIDEVSSNLKAITKLEHCKELETSFCDKGNLDDAAAKKRHQQQINQIHLKWWEKLDIYDDI